MLRYLITLLLFPFFIFSKPIEEFIRQDLKLDTYFLQKNLSEDLVEGGKLAEIFFLQEEKKSKTLVIKRFSKELKEDKEFLKEKTAYEYLKTKDFFKFCIPDVTFQWEDEEYYYLVLSLAEGRTLNGLLKDRKQLPFWNREQYDIELTSAMKKSAQAIYELHKSGNITYLKNVDSSSSRSLVEKMAKDLNIPYITEQYEELKSKIQNKPLRFGIVHGDLHLGNIFYAPKKDKITLIDFSTLSGQVSIAKLPQSEEIANFITHFEVIAYMHGLSSKEISSFIKSFEESYPNYEEMKDEIAYFRFITLLRLLEICEGGSKDSYLNYQMNVISKYSKRVISSLAVS